MTRYTGWELPETEKERLLVMFPPAYPVVIAHHVTLAYGVEADFPLPVETRGEVVGIADHDGVQALVVAISGTTDRPDGSTYHITWSLDRARGRKPVDSNRVIREYGFRTVPPVILALEPKLFS